LMAAPTGDWSVIRRGDGTPQWAYKGRPLYTFIKDTKAGDTNGDGVGGHWHVVLL
jgi:predicted lipoprotein with Yx(FWY)xxD motif